MTTQQLELEVSDDGGRVLSIQSHVVQGYVGNKSAVFPLQLLGMDVDPINSVQFSNHTGYAKFTGRRLTGDELHELLDGMEINNLLKDAHTHLLTGYIGSISLLDAIVRVYERIRAAQTHPERLVYVCDPVMGDLGKLYVPLELVDLYRSKVLPICDVLTPNQYECELLAEMELQAHTLGPKVVVISSFQEASEGETPKELVVIGSKVIAGGVKEHPSRCEQYEVRFPWIDSYYTGTGDLFAALLLAWLYRFPGDFKHALENVISTIQDVLRITLKLGGKDCDLKLIQSRHVIANPTVRFFAKPLSVPVLNGKVVDVPADASIQRRELLSALVPLVGAENVNIVTNYTVPSTQALLDQFAKDDMGFKVISSADVGAKALPADTRIETRNCETLVVSSSATLTDLASRALYQVAPSTVSDQACSLI
ncbi:Ribokinase-like [Phytophthora cactorum]|nr:Ribokinase-like [Phytophthora cactorum]